MSDTLKALLEAPTDDQFVQAELVRKALDDMNRILSVPPTCPQCGIERADAAYRFNNGQTCPKLCQYAQFAALHEFCVKRGYETPLYVPDNGLQTLGYLMTIAALYRKVLSDSLAAYDEQEKTP